MIKGAPNVGYDLHWLHPILFFYPHDLWPLKMIDDVSEFLRIAIFTKGYLDILFFTLTTFGLSNSWKCAMKMIDVSEFLSIAIFTKGYLDIKCNKEKLIHFIGNFIAKS